MLSIITCTASITKTEILRQNIKATIGIEYEFLPFDNSVINFSLSKVYNLQSKKAKYNFICFVHDDVKFVTHNWGSHLLRYFLNDKNIGLIGIAGSSYKTFTPSIWSKIPDELLAANIIQHYKYNTNIAKHLFWKNTHKETYDVVTIDGVFMATTKEILNQYSFDERLLDGFHGYDFDFSMQVFQSHKNIVVYDILLEHFSEGKADNAWLTACERVSEKWRHKLPAGLHKLNKLERDRLEYAALFVGFRILKESESNTAYELIKYYLKYFRFSFLFMPLLKKRINKNLKSKLTTS